MMARYQLTAKQKQHYYGFGFVVAVGAGLGRNARRCAWVLLRWVLRMAWHGTRVLLQGVGAVCRTWVLQLGAANGCCECMVCGSDAPGCRRSLARMGVGVVPGCCEWVL